MSIFDIIFSVGRNMKYLKFFIFINFIFGQTYSVGDYVDNFSAEICYNGEGTWEWEVDGFNKVVWISSFATW